MKKPRIVTIRLTPEVAEKMIKAAKAHKMVRSEYYRMCLVAGHETQK